MGLLQLFRKRPTPVINVACSSRTFSDIWVNALLRSDDIFIWNFTCSAADWNCDINPICIHANELARIDEIEHELERPSGHCQRRMKDVKVPLTILHTFMQIFQLKSTYRIL
jgi:hypothetical protein